MNEIIHKKNILPRKLDIIKDESENFNKINLKLIIFKRLKKLKKKIKTYNNS